MAIKNKQANKRTPNKPNQHILGGDLPFFTLKIHQAFNYIVSTLLFWKSQLWLCAFSSRAVGVLLIQKRAYRKFPVKDCKLV